MPENKIVSFSDYLKRKNKSLSADADFINKIGEEIKGRPELIEWYGFQNTFNKHKLFLYRLFSENQNEDNINPNAGYFISFTKEQIDDNKNKIIGALNWLNKDYITIDANNCTFKEMASQIYNEKPKGNYEAWKMFEEILLNSSKVLMISEISKSKIASRKSWYARSIIKFNDDAHLKGVKPQSEILFVDDACFLQRSWSELGPYINIYA